MSAKWTVDQTKAICESGGNILVSAAAGSGKTAVLVERILKIIKEKTDIDRLLIVTFTSAAASELRERLYISLQKELEDENISPSVAKRLTKQQILLSKSYITTIHSFCQSIIKSNSIESGVDASFRIADTGEITLIRSDVMEEVTEHYYEEKNAGFLRLVEIYSDYRSDKGLIELLFSLYDFAQSSPDPEGWLTEQKNSFNTELISDFTETKWCRDIIRDIYITVSSYIDNFKDLHGICERFGLAEYEKMIKEDLPVLENAAELFARCLNGDVSCKWKDVFNAVSAIQFGKAPVMTAKRKAAYDEAALDVLSYVQDERKKITGKIKSSLLAKIGSYPEAPYDDMNILQKDMECLIDVVLDFAEAYKKTKYDRHIMDFNDLEHIAFKTLCAGKDENGLIKSDVAKRCSEYFSEVYIDEYQDTNELQDAILYLVSKNGEENSAGNMFLVGDVKQSIYGFRQARPDIFIDKYRRFDRADSEDILIRLNKNFRSRETVLRSVNTVFKKIMTENTCSIVYNENEFLNFGASYYPETSENCETELHIINNAKNSKEGLPISEAEVTAAIVESLIDSKFKIFDRKLSVMRDVTYRDIVILMRAPSGGDAGKRYAKAMKKLGIPAYYSEEGGFFANAEVNILLSFMKIIDNPLQDIHFAAVLRNIYGFTDSEMAEIKVNNIKRGAEEEFFIDMCRNYSADGELKENLNKVIQRIDTLRNQAQYITVSELLWQIMHENHFYENLKRGPLGELHIANVNVLYSQAIIYDNNTNKGLFRFLYYFDKLKKRKGDLSEASAAAEGMNVVRIMSIHKSKGLEFPIVILSETGRAFNKRDISAPVLMHRLIGLGPTCYLEDKKVKYPSVMKFCVGRKIDADNKAEEMRVLYVAMTRASEKLIITGSVKGENYLESYKNPTEYNVLEAKNYLEWILMSGAAEKENIHIYEYKETCGEETADSDTSDINTCKAIPQPPKTFYAEIYEKERKEIPAKISVSDLKAEHEKTQERKTVNMNDLPGFLHDKSSDLTAAQKGTAIHTCLQLIDYSKIRGISEEEALKYAEEIIIGARDKGFLDENAAETVPCKLIAQYIRSRLAQRISEADEVEQELPFTLLEQIDGNTTAVQGIIDCLIKEKDMYTVIDFKTDAYPDAEKYRLQLEYYGKIIKKTCGVEPQKIVYFIKHNKEVLI